MSFGRREREVRDWKEPSTTNADIAAVINREPRTGANLNGNSGGGLTAILISAVLVAGLVGMVYGGRHVISEALFGGLTPKPKMATPAHHAKVAEICGTGSEEADNLVDRMSSDFLGIDGDVRKPSYLTCMMSKRVERFCDATERKEITKDLTNYFKYVQYYNANRERALRDPRSRQMLAIYSKIRENIDASEGRGEGVTRSHSNAKELDQSVVDMMQQLVRDGYLSDGDFGWSLPSHMAPHFEGVTKEKESC